MTEQGGFAERC